MFKILGFGIRAGIGTSAVYYTIDNGVWADSDVTAKIYEQVTAEAGQLLGPYLEKVPLPDIPRTGSVAGTTQNAWNAAVKSSCKFLAASPVCAAGMVKRGYKYVEEQVAAAMANPNSSPSA